MNKCRKLSVIQVNVLCYQNRFASLARKDATCIKSETGFYSDIKWVFFDFHSQSSLKLKMKTNGVEKNSEDNHLNKIKIKVKKKKIRKKVWPQEFFNVIRICFYLSGFVFTYVEFYTRTLWLSGAWSQLTS